MALRARELFGRYPIKSKVATKLVAEFGCGRPLAYRAIGVALEAFKAELAGRGEVDALLIAYCSLTSVLGGDDAKPRDRVQAAAALIKLIGAKAFTDLADAGDVEGYLATVLARRDARLVLAPPEPIPTTTEGQK